jgi:SAM-dependent methyltransferase
LCGRFYRTVADLVEASAGPLPGDVSRVCDVGGGLGRFLYELSRRSWGRDGLVLAEPAGPLCAWAARLLAGAPFDGRVPVVTAARTVEYRPVDPARRPESLPNLTIARTTAAGLGYPTGYFDLVGCLNVVDRVPDPAALVATLGRLLRPGGVLALASPFEFRPDLTPRTARVSDLRAVLPEADWAVRAIADPVPYEFRTYDRGRLRFDSQVVVATRYPGLTPDTGRPSP